MARDRGDTSWEQYWLSAADTSAVTPEVRRQTAALRALATLSRGNEVLVRAQAEGDLLQRMCDAIVAAGDYLLAWYGRPLDDVARTVQPVAAAGPRASYVDGIEVSWGDGPLGLGPTGTAIRTRSTQVRNDLATDPLYEPWLDRVRAHGLICSVALPVVVGDAVDGALMVYAAETGSFDDLALTLLEDLAADIGFGLRRLRDAAILDRTLEELARSRAEYRLLAEHASDFVMRSSPDGTIEWVSPSTTRALGWTEAELVGRQGMTLGHPDEMVRARAESTLLNSGHEVSTLYRALRKDGTYRWFRMNVRPVTDESGAVVARVSAWQDAQAEVEADEARAASEGMFRKAMESAAIGMIVAAPDGTMRLVNPALCAMLDRDAEWLCSHRLVDLVHPDDRERVVAERAALLATGGESYVSQVRLLRLDGTSIWVRRTAVIVRDADGQPESTVLQIEDVTAERRAREQLAFQAFHDPLTGLRNRAWIVDMLESDLLEARRAGKAVGVLFVDLDNFKVVNESLGHVAGDEMLASVARRIAAALSSDYRIGRFGGDEFLVVIPAVGAVLDVEAVAERVASAVSAPLDVSGHNVVTSASIGVAMSTDLSTPESLLRDADAAVHRAKSAGRARWHFFDEEMHAAAVERLTVEDDLRRGLVAHELTAYYQPLVDLRDRSVVGHEALVRWVHPEKGVLTPYAFLGVAEESGLVIELGQQVLESVCARIASTPALPGAVSVNVSAVQLGRRDWAQSFLDTIRRHGVDPRRLVIEVTETAVLSLLGSVHDDLVALRGLGIGLHVDDFGTGYSSIALLRDLPVTGLKLDRSFVSALTSDDSQANALSSGLAALARSLHLDGVAEGVETEQQAEILRAHGWPLGQGYLFGRPEGDPRLR